MNDQPRVPARMTALHEAGHAVAVAFHGGSVESVTIVRNGIAAGEVKTKDVEGIGEVDRAAGVGMLEGAIVVRLAGDLAAYAGGERQGYRGTDDDHEVAAEGVESLLQMTPWVGDFESFARFQMLRAQGWIYRNMGAINALAEVLLDRKKMNGDEVSSVIDPFLLGIPRRERSHDPRST